MNFCFYEPSENEIKSDILRGMGHVMGLDFEHKHPDSPIEFKSTADFIDAYNLSEQEIEEFKRIYLASEVDVTTYDKNSIMMVVIPKLLVTDRNSVIVSANTELSVKDKEMITKIYPMEVITLTIKGNCASIGVGATYWAPNTEPDNLRRVDWGDGRKQPLAQDADYYHQYPKDSTWTVRLYGNTTTYVMFLSMKNTSSIDVTKSKALETLYCDNGTLQELDLSRNPNLKLLSCMNNNLTKLDLSHNKQVEQVSCQNNKLEIAGLQQLTHLWCRNNKLERLDVTKNPLLKLLDCHTNSFDILTIAQNLLVRPAAGRGDFRAADNAEKARVQSVCNSKNWDVYVPYSRSAYSSSGTEFTYRKLL